MTILLHFALQMIFSYHLSKKHYRIVFVNPCEGVYNHSAGGPHLPPHLPAESWTEEQNLYQPHAHDGLLR